MLLRINGDSFKQTALQILAHVSINRMKMNFFQCMSKIQCTSAIQEQILQVFSINPVSVVSPDCARNAVRCSLVVTELLSE